MIPIYSPNEILKSRIMINRLDDSMEYKYDEIHRHDYFEFFVFLKGGGSQVIDFELFNITDLSIHIVAPGQVHQVRREPGSNGYVVLFETDVFPQNSVAINFLFDHICLSVLENSPYYHFQDSSQIIVKECIEEMYSDYLKQEAFFEESIIANLTRLFITCLRSRTNPAGGYSSGHRLYSDFRKAIIEKYMTFKKVKEFASYLNVSEKQLNETVYRHTGQTASKLIQKQLVIEAKRQLQMGIPAKEVAYNLNFTDPAHFSKFFKTQTGKAPSQI